MYGQHQHVSGQQIPDYIQLKQETIMHVDIKAQASHVLGIAE